MSHGDVFVKFRYEERDIAAALRLRMFSTLRRRGDLALAPLVFVCACIATYLYVPAGPVRWVIMAGGALLVGAVVATFVIVPRVMFRRRAALHVPMSIDASDEGLTFVAGPLARTIAWSDCARVEKSTRICVIHHGDEVLLLPRRAFRNASRDEAFFDLVKRFASLQASRDNRLLESGKSTPSANQ